MVSGDLLLDVTKKIGIDPERLRATEWPNNLGGTFEVGGESLSLLDANDLSELKEVYQAALTLVIRLGDQPKVTIGSTPDEAQAFQSSINSAQLYNVVLKLDKAKLLKLRLGEKFPAEGWHVYWFLFPATLEGLLKKGLEAFEEQVWKEEKSRMALLIDGPDLSVHGTLLSVYGGDYKSEVLQAFAEPQPDWPLVEHLRKARYQYISWDREWTGHLTPHHFNVAIGAGKDSTLASLLAAQAVKLALLFTCDRARSRQLHGSAFEIRAEFRGQQFSTVVPLKQDFKLPAAEQGCLEAVQKLVLWCYRKDEAGKLERDWVQDRLPFVQTRIAQALVGHDEDSRIAALLNYVPYLLEGLEWHWKAFIEGRVSEYLDKVQQLEELVTKTVSTFAERTAALAKGLSDAVLAAVAVLVGSFLAAAFKEPFNATLFRIGVLVYAGYVLIFPGALGLAAQWSLHQVFKNEFQHQVERFKALLPPERVAQLVGDRVRNASNRFVCWFVVAALGYAAVFLAALAAAAIVPFML